MNITHWDATNFDPSFHWTQLNSHAVTDIQRDYVKKPFFSLQSSLMLPLCYVETDKKNTDVKKNTAGINIVHQQTITGTVLY
jgi:hypothetical protein